MEKKKITVALEELPSDDVRKINRIITYYAVAFPKGR